MPTSWADLPLKALLASMNLPVAPTQAMANLVVPVLADRLGSAGWQGRLLVHKVSSGENRFYLCRGSEAVNYSGRSLSKTHARMNWHSLSPSPHAAQLAEDSLDKAFLSQFNAAWERFLLDQIAPACERSTRPRL